jgi:hypothetical protein
MILRGREFRIEIDGLLKFPQGLVAALQHRHEETDFVLRARRTGCNPVWAPVVCGSRLGAGQYREGQGG